MTDLLWFISGVGAGIGALVIFGAFYVIRSVKNWNW